MLALMSGHCDACSWLQDEILFFFSPFLFALQDEIHERDRFADFMLIILRYAEACSTMMEHVGIIHMEDMWHSDPVMSVTIP